MYQTRIYGFTRLGEAPLILWTETLGAAVRVIETDLYTCLKPGISYIAEIWHCIGTVPVKMELKKTVIVKP